MLIRCSLFFLFNTFEKIIRAFNFISFTIRLMFFMKGILCESFLLFCLDFYFLFIHFIFYLFLLLCFILTACTQINLFKSVHVQKKEPIMGFPIMGFLLFKQVYPKKRALLRAIKVMCQHCYILTKVF
jgi:hypothetical protein